MAREELGADELVDHLSVAGDVEQIENDHPHLMILTSEDQIPFASDRKRISLGWHQATGGV